MRLPFTSHQFVAMHCHCDAGICKLVEVNKYPVANGTLFEPPKTKAPLFADSVTKVNVAGGRVWENIQS